MFHLKCDIYAVAPKGSLPISRSHSLGLDFDIWYDFGNLGNTVNQSSICDTYITQTMLCGNTLCSVPNRNFINT